MFGLSSLISNIVAGALLAAVLALGVVVFKDRAAISDLTTQVAQQKALVAQEQVLVEQGKAALSQADANKAALQAAIADDNQRIAAIQADYESKSAAATTAALRSLDESRRRAAESKPGSGFKEMNEWFAELRAAFPPPSSAPG